MSDQLIGKSEVTWELVNALENLADAQQQCEAQFVAAVYHKRALDDRRVDVSKAFDACRKFECLDVDKMMEQKFVVTSQMIDAYRAELLGQTSAPVATGAMIYELADAQEPMGDDLKKVWVENTEELYTDSADELNDLSPHEGEEEDGLPEWAKLKADDGDWQPYDYSGKAPDNVVSVLYADGEVDDAAGAAWLMYEEVVSENIPKEDVIIGYKTSTDEKHLEAQPVEQEAEPAPAPETVDHFAQATAQIEASIDEREEAAASAYDVGQKVTFEDDDGATLSGEISKVSQDFSTHEPFYNIDVLNENGVRESYFQVDHDRVTPIEAQAETESTETEAEPDTAETMQAIAQAVEAVDAEPEEEQAVHVFGEGEVQTFGEEGVFTEQPETASDDVEAAIDAAPPAAIPIPSKTPVGPTVGVMLDPIDATGDYTQEEVQALSGFDPRTQSDDIAAKEPVAFVPHNPWAPTAKAEG
jgi:hypothetical protein